MFDRSKILIRKKSPVGKVRNPDSVANTPYGNGLYPVGVTFQRVLGNQAMIRLAKHEEESSLQVNPTSDTLCDRYVPEPSDITVKQSAVPYRIMRLPAEPYVRQINVDVNTPQNVSLDWQGTPPEEVRSTFRCSTGKGYGDADDPPGICNRDCCVPGVNPCAPPYDQRTSVGSCCTPVGDFVIQHKDREHRVIDGTIPFWMYFYRRRGIAIHEYSPVDGTPLSHGCVRLDSVNAEMLFNYSHERVTRVNVSGTATPACPPERECGRSSYSESPGASEERRTDQEETD